MARIPLGGQNGRPCKYPGLEALVDDEFVDQLLQKKWFADKAPRTFYAREGKVGGIRMRHLVMTLITGAPLPSGMMVDHKNGDGLDNRRENLRLATRQQNNANKGFDSRKTTSVYKGVNWHKQRGKWCASIQVNKKRIHLGLYNCEIDAANRYDEAAVKHFGEFARLNFPELLELRIRSK